MHISIAKQSWLTLLAIACSVVGSAQLVACPFCSAPSLTLTEQITESDAAVLVEWVSAKKGEGDSAGTTTYRIKEIHIEPQPEQEIKVGEKITLTRHRTGEVGDLYLLLGSSGIDLEWNSPLEVTSVSYDYLTNAPAPDIETTKRLLYFMKYLEHEDQTVADDAFYEFANAPYKDIKQLTNQIPREKVKKWLTNPETPVTRIGLYGLLLGLSGNKDDAKLMKKIIVQQQDSLRLGIDGVMSGYILITGVEGLAFLENTKLKSIYLLDKEGKPLLDESNEKKRIPFSEVYATMQALRFMWNYGDDQIEKVRLRQSLRILLNRPELADLVIADLARWKDWSIQDKLIKLYDEEEYDVQTVKRAIIRYFLVCSVDKPKDSELPDPAHVVTAKKHLTMLKEKDPDMVKSAKRFFFLQ